VSGNKKQQATEIIQLETVSRPIMKCPSLLSLEMSYQTLPFWAPIGIANRANCVVRMSKNEL
jgi:hypothetical protein